MIVKYQYPMTENAASTVDHPPRNPKRFAEEEDGVMVVFSMFIILIILMVGGIGVDTMRFEMERTKLQNTIDRAVLAAADLDQTLSPKAVVEDYFVKAGITDVVPTVTPMTGIGFKTVSASATRQIDTQFMRMSGVDTMTIPAGATAEERVPNVEVSLVLDISGSMKDNNRLANLRVAAKEFIDATVKADTVNRVSINIVPYSEQVNVGSIIFDELNVNQLHSYSHCVEFDDADFAALAISTTKLHQQMQHFQWNTFSIQSGTAQNTRHDTVCPRNGYESVTAMSQNAAALKSSIDALRPRAGTAIYLGMKWGAYMLDPSFRPVNDKLRAANRSDANFSARPADYSDSTTLKTIVVMSDGENSSSARITSPYYGNTSHYVHWNDFNFNFYLSNYVNSWQRSAWWFEKYNRAKGNTLMQNLCTAAKNQGIVIWAIGFEVTTDGDTQLRNCASSPSHFFDVEGAEITSAFQSIARQINQLKLTQ
jgi:Flp pilus assembly protein TadG